MALRFWTCGRRPEVSDASRLTQVLREAGVVHIDAAVIALHVAAHPRYLPLTRIVLGGLAAGEFEGRTSALTLYQLLAEPYRRGREDTAAQLERYLAALPGLQVVPLSATIAGQAAQVRAQIGGTFERAAQIATALHGDAELFMTQRSALRRIAGMGVEQLDSYTA